MILSKEDGKLFYKLWLPLVDFVNKRYRVSSIISDGLIMPYNIYVGSNMKQTFKDAYMAKKNGRIQRTF